MSALTALSGIIYDLPEAEYHAHSAFSATQAKRLLEAEAPAEFHYNLTHPKPAKTAFDLGHAIHAKVLGVGAGVIAYPPEHLTPGGNVSEKPATKAWAAEQREKGLTPISPEQIDNVNGMAEAVLADAPELFEQDGHPETSLFVTDPETDIELRARFDFYAPVGVDLKSSAKPLRKWAFTMYDLGYDVQDGHYSHVRELITGEPAPFVFVAVRTAPPFLVGKFQPDREFREIGAGKARQARLIYAECLANGVWPRYPKQIQLTSPPMPAVYDYQDNYS